MKKHIFLIWLLSLIMIACSSDEDIYKYNVDNGKVELSFQIKSYIKGSLKSSSEVYSENEETIDSLYIFLFPTTSSQKLETYDISDSTFAGGSWNSGENKVRLDITQSEIGKRDVYIIANYSPLLKALLDTVTTIKGLKSLFQSSDTPWGSTFKTPILMSGNATHNFNTNYQLNEIPLIRALSKVQLNIKLSSSHQAVPISTERTAQYKYKLINFEKNTYIFKPITKKNELISLSSWSNWNDQITSYTPDDRDKVTSLTLITYLNESENAETAIELSVPYIDGGFLPPPEFGDETYKLQMPTKIERNHWYIYDIEI